MKTDLDLLQTRAKALNLNGLIAHWQEANAAGWVKALIEWEERERARRGLERRLREAHSQVPSMNTRRVCASQPGKVSSARSSARRAVYTRISMFS
jgi:hypothetical protein